MDRIAVTINTGHCATVASCIASNKRHLVQELEIIGPYQCRYDDETIRKMCNCINEEGVRSGGQLEVLDLSNAEIMDSCNGIYKTNVGSFWSSNSLKDAITLRKIIFGRSLESFFGRDVSGCISLERIEIVDNPLYKSINGVLYQYAKKWTTPALIHFNDGEWILIKVPAAIQDSSLIKFDKINRIESNAFEDTRLRSLTMPAVPPICDLSAFGSQDLFMIKLFVPKDSFNSYWSHPIWGQFDIQIIKD